MRDSVSISIVGGFVTPRVTERLRLLVECCDSRAAKDECCLERVSEMWGRPDPGVANESQPIFDTLAPTIGRSFTNSRALLAELYDVAPPKRIR